MRGAFNTLTCQPKASADLLALMLCSHKNRVMAADKQSFWHPDTAQDNEAASHHGTEHTKGLNCKHGRGHKEKEDHEDYHLQHRAGVSSQGAGLCL